MYEAIMERRKKALEKADQLTAICKDDCTARLPHTMDRKLACCRTCVVESKIRVVGFELEKTVRELRHLRRKYNRG